MELEQKVSKVSSAKVDTIAAMRIIKMANENPETLQHGFLLGIIEEEVIEVTNCYPVIDDLEEDQQTKNDDGMLEYARRHYLDNNKVGLFLITDQNRQFTLDWFEELHDLQFYIKYAFVLIYSLQHSRSGHPQPFSAYIITDKYSELQNKEEVTIMDLQGITIKHDRLYKSVPIEIAKTPLAQAFLYQFSGQVEHKYNNHNVQFLYGLSNNAKQMIDTVDDTINAIEKLNQDPTKQRKSENEVQKGLTTADLVEYMIQLNKLSFLSDTIKKEATFITEAEPTVQQLLK